MSPKLSVVVTVYNEEENIRPLVEQLTAAIAMGGPLEIGEDPIPGTPARVRQVLEKGLAIEPTERYPDMSAFVLALKEAPDWAANRRRQALRVTAMCMASLIHGAG